ncbi:DUF1833 family protein [Magnetococcus sp. PR-3]|uniref:DUF1833 family protein n=1 Tax=Magnetococcus sp. PR-3 TaxID=3120355 RepID=UPI002FCDEE02
MPDDRLSQAIREAYASAPADVVILHTLEIRHPAFVDDEEVPTAIRVVRDYVDLIAKLEASAPLNPGESVTFVALAFNLELPPVESTPMPEIVVTLDNVSGEIMKHLDRAVQTMDPIEITYRPYLSTDLEGPQMDPPLTLTITEVEADMLQVRARARMMDIGNKAFPADTYRASRFPGLAR